ncbi:hypothetical protein G6O69_36975, partial [Pseudenhygromyxa sp. WMMC2535]|uniref:DUF6178 family protein n=1 Tax=Pseudenhygromyxa sp. WMMC2535 TaxID=2712867 RepID=UPI001595FE48|nr:hypothetical protein [Pseudenhygromyxa sp. WMMC2535]
MTGPDPRDVAPIPYPVEEIQLVIDEPISLDERDDAPEVVAALPVQSFVTVARKLRAENRLDLVLRYASPAQIVGVFDLDAWERDRIAVARAREWLDRIVDAYREGQAERGELVELMLSTEPELWVLANAAATAIAELDEPDDDEARQRVLEDMAALRTWETPDGFFVVGVPDNELGRMALRVLEAIYADSITEGRKLISAIKWSLHAELEEDLLRWRKGRLADLGFPDWEEAMRLFSPLARDAIVRDDLDSSDTDSSDTDSSDTDSDKKAAAKPRPQTHVPPTGNLPLLASARPATCSVGCSRASTTPSTTCACASSCSSPTSSWRRSASNPATRPSSSAPSARPRAPSTSPARCSWLARPRTTPRPSSPPASAPSACASSFASATARWPSCARPPWPCTAPARSRCAAS